MKIYAPEYYEKFKCTANKCKHSCCIGWRIGLDEQTVGKYRAAEGIYADELKRYIAEDEDGAYIPHVGGGRCSHLDECGLCRVIINRGEDYLSEICREHPRFYNEFAGRIEVGLGASCEAAARLILAGESSLEICVIGENAETSAKEGYYTSLPLRSEIQAILATMTDYGECEAKVASLVSLPPSVLCRDFRKKVLDEIEYLDHDDHLVLSSTGGHANDAYLKRILSYFIYRHLSSAESDVHAASIIGFALLSVRAVEAASARVGLAEALRIYSEEIEYSTGNTEDIIFAIESEMI